MSDQLKPQAIQFLKEEFQPDLDYKLNLEATFTHHPIKGEGLVALFSFEVEQQGKYYIFIGNCMPMIYPQMDLTLEELWAVHLGSEYFVEMGVTEDPSRRGPAFLSYLKMVSTVFQEQLYIYKPDSIKIEKIYCFQDQKHVVGHATFQGKTYSWIVGDIPHFVYKKDLPPHVIWALHMGRILLT